MTQRKRSEESVIIERLWQLKAEKTEREREENLLWNRLNQIADDKVGEGKPYRYLEKSLRLVAGRTLAVSESLDTEALQQDPEFTPAMKNLVVVKREYVEPSLLEGSINTGKIPAELVRRHTQVKESLRKLSVRPATKAEQAELDAEEEMK